MPSYITRDENVRKKYGVREEKQFREDYPVNVDEKENDMDKPVRGMPKAK